MHQNAGLEKLAVIVTFVEKRSWGTEMCIVSRSASQNNLYSLQQCRKSAYDCSQLNYINNAGCDQQYNNLLSHPACCVNTAKSKLLWICILASFYPINLMLTLKLSNSIYMMKTITRAAELNANCYVSQKYIEVNVLKCHPSSLYVLDHQTHSTHCTEKSRPSPQFTLLFNASVAHLKSHVNSSHGYQWVLCLIIPSPLSQDERELYNHREIEQLFWRMR